MLSFNRLFNVIHRGHDPQTVFLHPPISLSFSLSLLSRIAFHNIIRACPVCGRGGGTRGGNLRGVTRVVTRFVFRYYRYPKGFYRDPRGRLNAGAAIVLSFLAKWNSPPIQGEQSSDLREIGRYKGSVRMRVSSIAYSSWSILKVGNINQGRSRIVGKMNSKDYY